MSDGQCALGAANVVAGVESEFANASGGRAVGRWLVAPACRDPRVAAKSFFRWPFAQQYDLWRCDETSRYVHVSIQFSSADRSAVPSTSFGLLTFPFIDVLQTHSGATPEVLTLLKNPTRCFFRNSLERLEQYTSINWKHHPV